LKKRTKKLHEYGWVVRHVPRRPPELMKVFLLLFLQKKKIFLP